jgi:hypothetical protein
VLRLVVAWRLQFYRSWSRAVRRREHQHNFGLITFNGDGTATQEDFIIRNGTEVAGGPPNPSGFHTGETVTYTVNSDCTGVLIITLTPGNTRSSAFVITQRGKAIHAVGSEATTNGALVLLQVYSDFESLNAH